ncbi:MAG TPA: superoxide dismutase [Planctomycetota bacterium]|nr:superoxide dismutase [Planctomycetota bacterium]
MTFRLPPLPYAADALEPHISSATLHEHHEQHHRGYLDKVNRDVRGTSRADWTLERLVESARSPLLEQAAQAWNHEFYFAGLSPHGGRPRGALADAIDAAFGDLAALRREFTEAATGHFGSGWAWLVADARGRLSVRALHDAGTPLREGGRPLLACDVWEHAYYLDRKHDRAAYLRAFWRVVDWEFVGANYARTEPFASRASDPVALRDAS